MLTITAPIELKCKTPGHSMHEGFYHRVADQYAVMNSRFEPEDLLHIVTTPPEYYFGEGDETNIFRQTNVAMHQENKLEVINNLINRMMISESAQLTYQDRVYITDILQKIGIHNVNEFMKQVRNIREEQNQTNQLIELYWNHAGELRQLVENYRSEQTIDHHTQETNEQSQTLHLHEDILNRLQTAAIYQTIQNFNSSMGDDVHITHEQLQISEQYRTAQQILLQKLKSEARGEQTPLVYRHENYYEDQQLTQEQINESHVLSQVSSAVLLDLIDHVQLNLREEHTRGGDRWYHMEQAFYQNAENTMQRIEQRMSTGYEINRIAADTYQNSYHQAQQQEISLLNRLFTDRSQAEYQTVNELLRQDLTQQELVNRITQAGDIDQETLIEQMNLAQYYTDHSGNVVNRLLDRHITQQQELHNHLLRQSLEQQTQNTVQNEHIEQRTRMDHRTTVEGDTYEDQSVYEQTQNIDRRDLSTVEQELSRINRQNINNQSKYIQMMEGIRESMERPREAHSPEQMRRESLMALEHPTELMEQLRADGRRQHEEQQTKLEHVMNLLPEQTRAVYEVVREYLEAPQQVRHRIEGVSDDMGILIRDLHEAQMVQQRSELVHKQQEQIHEQTREVIDRWNERTPVEPDRRQVYEDRFTDVTMVHRSLEQQLDEEEIRQMIEQNRIQNRKTVHTQTESVTDYDTTQRQYTNINTQQIIEQTENVNELVRQGIQRELGSLSEKIYHKLEKRLETEKRRRGY